MMVVGSAQAAAVKGMIGGGGDDVGGIQFSGGLGNFAQHSNFTISFTGFSDSLVLNFNCAGSSP